MGSFRFRGGKDVAKGTNHKVVSAKSDHIRQTRRQDQARHRADFAPKDPQGSNITRNSNRTASTAARKRILVVDESPASRFSVVSLLHSAGHQPLEASNGSEALEVARIEKPDVIISSVIMPLMDGYEFARRLRADPVIGKTPIIFHTNGHDEIDARLLAHSCGVFHILPKPAGVKLLHAVNDVFSGFPLAAAKSAPLEDFDARHRQLLTARLSKKVKELEAALKDSQEKEVQLREMIEKAIRAERAVEETNKHLQQKTEEIGNFYHTVSHELKTPLTSAREFISIVMDGLAGPLTKTQQEYLRIALESCDRLHLCIDDLTDATRIETGKLNLELRLGSIAKLVQELAAVLAPVAARRQISLTYDIEPDLPEFCFDEQRLMQVMVNLVNNAFKFTPAGGKVTIVAAMAPERPDHVKISVTDTGSGLPPAELDRIFDRLYQTPRPDTGSEQGLGLGLYICRELIRCHRGKIWVESEVGKGSTFSFIIPRHQSDTAHVLLVDDDPRFRQLMSRALTRKGFKVTTAEDGTVALESMKRELPDLVITDFDMPKMNGVETLKGIRQEWGLLPVVILTGCSDTPDMARAMEFSPFTLLSKPCPPEQLIRTIHSLRPRKNYSKSNNADRHLSQSIEIARPRPLLEPNNDQAGALTKSL